MLNYFKRGWVVLQIVPYFIYYLFTKQGLFSREGRIQVWGKCRRSWLSVVPPLVRALQKKHGLKGECAGWGASCRLMFVCPHLDTLNNRCTVYEHRPDACRQFPVTPDDIRDRNLVNKNKPCGFKFQK